MEVPQTRDGEFYAQSLTKGLRSERALLLAIAEMYVQGVSTRRVKKIVEELCGMEISSTQVSRAAAELDEMLEAWPKRRSPKDLRRSVCRPAIGAGCGQPIWWSD